MTTDLLVFGGEAPVPPECRRPVTPLPAWTRIGSRDAVVEFPVLTPRAPATRILPSLSLRFGGEYTFRFEARVEDTEDWVAASPVGRVELDAAATPPPPGARLSAEIDIFLTSSPARHLDLRLRVRADDLGGVLAAPVFASVSLSDEQPSAEEPRATDRIQLDVPALSQMDAPAAVRHRICSPTSVAMVLAYWKRPVGVEALAEELFDVRHDLYGIWPAAICAASRRGVDGYLLRFPSWAAAAWCLQRGLPVIASVRYAAGELQGAAIEATPGHLIVLTGYEQDMVFVNDPAAPTCAEVSRRYALADLRRVWLGRTGVGYVLFTRTSTSDA
jgi:hypothetical protein